MVAVGEDEGDHALRLVAGKSCSGKSGYIMARFEVVPTGFVELLHRKDLRKGLVVHFPLAREMRSGTGEPFGTQDVLKRLHRQHPEAEVDFLYCARGEMRRRLAQRKHTEQSLVGYPDQRGPGYDDDELYRSELLAWLNWFRSNGWKCTFIHSSGGRYFERDEAHFRRTVTGRRSLADTVRYGLKLTRPVAIRGWGTPLESG